MKRKIFLIILFLMFFIPVLSVNAATTLSTNNQSPVVGTEFDVTTYIDYGNSKIASAHYKISYDSSCFSLQKVKWHQDKGTYRNQNGVLYIDKEVTNKSWEKGIPFSVTFKANKTCRSVIKLETNAPGATYENGSKVTETTNSVTINAVSGDSNTQLSSLSISGYDIHPTFNRNITSYSLSVPADVDSITVNAQKGHDKQTITGNGVVNLNYGDNRIRVVVTSENGQTNTYEIMVTREDNRTGDTSLSSLNVSNTDIKFSKNIDTYEATVSRSVESVFITARAANSKATLTGTGQKNLNIGLNTFEIKVKADNGQEKIYTIKITRSTEEIQKEIESTKLLSLKLNDRSIPLDDKTKVYLFGVSKDVTELNVSTVTESKTATVETTGNEKIPNGFSTVIVKVTEKNNETREYRIIIYKEPNKANVLPNLDNLTKETLGEIPLYYALEGENKIDKNLLNTLKELKESLYYNVVNENHGLLYQIKLDSTINASSLNLTFNKVNGSPLTYETSLPAGVSVVLYLDTELYQDGTNLKIYTFNEQGAYEVLSQGTIFENGYISFITNGQKNYLFTTQDLIPEESFFSKVVKTLEKIIIAIVLLTIIGIIIYKVVMKKKALKEQGEPLY